MVVVYGRAALRDVYAIAARLERESGSLPVDFADDLRKVESLVAGSPEAGRATRRSATRVILMRRFQCHVIYRRLSAERIRIVRVRDARRRPLSWV